MDFQILYCGPCGYRERADALARELRDRLEARGRAAEGNADGDDFAVRVEEGKFGQFDVLLDGQLVASKGGFWKRKLKHGAPPQPQLLEAIERALAVREGDACEVPGRP